MSIDISSGPNVAASKAVLVTGGAGYIGSHACKALAAAGYLPVAYDNLVHGHEWAVKWGPFVRGDLADAARVRQTIKSHRITAIMHFAAYCYVGESMSVPERYFRNNVVNTLDLLDAARECGVSLFVFSSTCATYGMPVSIPMSEDHPQYPINPYGDSKLMVEKMLAWQASAHGLRWSALRYFNAAGADAAGEIGENHDPETHLIPLALQASLGQRSSIDVYGSDYPTPDGTAIRDYIHVTDLADAHVKALQLLERGTLSIALNLGTGSGHSVREVIDMARAVSGRDIVVRDAPRRAGDPPALVADATRAAEALQWQPRHSSLRNIVETAWRWHSRQGAPHRGGAATHSSQQKEDRH